jgi:RHS repeat-associated protein
VQYLYEGQQALGEIRDGQLSHRLLTGLSLDETIARIAINTAGNKDATASRIYLTDALNSVIAQLGDDNSANLQNSYAYSPYGQSSTVGPDSTNNPNQYTSRENDNTGLYFYRARYYDPVLKRFISSDPIGLEGGINTYSYVGGNPLSFTDPSGLREVQGTFGIGGLFGYGWGSKQGQFYGWGLSIGVAISECKVQLIGQVQGTDAKGYGAYAGAGVQGGLGYSPNTTQTGMQTSYTVEANAGLGASVGGAFQFGEDGYAGAGGGGRYGGGFGAAYTAGKTYTYTKSMMSFSNPYGRLMGQCGCQ